MTLYEKFATHYDDIFPLNADTLQFLVKHFERGKTLELGSATGEYALGLSRLGFEILGIDIDPKMVEISLSKSKRLSLLARFLQGNCLDVVYKNQFFNIYCIGNTLVHLHSLAEIKQSLHHVYESLKPGGTFVVQIINFDRIIEKEIKSLPTIKNNGISFVRKYDYDGEKIHFMSTLKLKDEDIENETILYPITSPILINTLQEVGFRDLEIFDGFSIRPFKAKDSYQLVIVAKK